MLKKGETMAAKRNFYAKLIVDPKLENFFNNSLKQSQQRSVIMSGFRKAGKILLNEAKNNLKTRRKSKNTRSNLYRSLGIKANNNKLTLKVGARIERNKFFGYHGHLVNEGTKERFRKTKSGKRVSTGRMPGNRFWCAANIDKTNEVRNSLSKHIEQSLIDWTKKKNIKI